MVITFKHEYGPTQDLAKDAANYLILQGYDVQVLIQGDPKFNAQLAASITHPPDVAVMIGTIAFNLSTGDEYVWQRWLKCGTFILKVLLDQIPYCLRNAGFNKFLLSYKDHERIKIIALEKNICDILSNYTGRHVYFQQLHAFLHQSVAVERNDRWLFWCSIDTGLASNLEQDTLFETIKNNNTWGLDDKKISTVADHLIHDNDFFTYTALASILEIDVREIVSDQTISSLCAIDSKLKKERRLMLVNGLANFPVDVFGKGWERYIDFNKTKMRHLTATPDLHSTYSLLSQRYAAVVNIDPNWGYGAHDRVATALHYGTPVLTNRNFQFMDCTFQYTFSGGSLAKSAQAMLNSSAAFYNKSNTPISFYDQAFSE